MHAVWTRLRYLVARVMLAAMMSFVFHGSAVAGMHPHGAAAVSGCGSHASADGHAHSAGSHHDLTDHADDGDDVHTDHESHDGKSASSEPCCGSMCSIAISARVPDTFWAPLSVPVELTPDVRGRPDNLPDGLKRPPRTPDIA